MSSSTSANDTKSETSTETTNVDERLNLAAGGVGGTASSGGTVTINTNSTDPGAFALARQSVDAVTRQQGEGLDKLLGSFEKLISAGTGLVKTNSDLAHDALLAYAPTDTSKTQVDNKKTILIGGGIVAVAFIASAIITRH